MKKNSIKLEKGEIMVEVEVVTFKEGKFYMSLIPSLDLYAQSKISKIDSAKELHDALALFFKIHTKKGNLDERLINLGWKKRDHKIVPPLNTQIPTTLLSFNPQRAVMDIAIPAYV
jgi:hypothetical protein